jgi:hypothetical protein
MRNSTVQIRTPGVLVRDLAGIHAHDGDGYALADGSNQNIGLDNTFYTGTLAQTAPGYYVIGNCP